MEPKDEIGEVLGLPPATENPLVEQGEPNYQLAGEALAAVTGPFWQGPVTRTQGEEAEGLAAEVEKQVAKFCRFGKFDAFKLPPRADYEKVWAQLQPLDDAEEAAADGLAVPEIATAWIETVNRARAAAAAVWPVAIRQTPTGPEWLPPSRTEGGRADDVLLVLEDPIELLREMNRGSMTPAQVEAVRAAYPQLYGRALVLFDVALKAAGAAGKKCPWSHENLLRLLFGLPPVGLVTFKPRGPKTEAPGGDIRIDFEGMKTKNQTVR